MKNCRSLPVGSVKLSDPFLAPRIEADYRVTIPTSIDKCRETGRIDSFRLNWKPGMPNRPHIFWDSDFAKVIEGMCYAVALHPEDHRMAAELDGYIDLIVSAQQPDGYLNTYFTQVAPADRWKNIFDWHELYCAGHLIEAAVAHYEVTGSRKFLDTMCRYADYIGTVFGPEADRMHGYPGHEELELALCKLADATGNAAYFRLAKYFVDERGKSPNFFQQEDPGRNEGHLKNRQAHKPVREQRDADGHSVRALYLYAGMADVAERSNDAELLDACKALFDSIAEKRMYITGGCGSTLIGEAFTVDYNLPNDTAYAESCASMALVQFARRLLNITRQGHYADVMEQALYNGVLSGISLQGSEFFYANLLEVSSDTFTYGHIRKERQPWFDCSCCPTSFCRFLPQLGSFAWSEAENELRLNIPAAGSVNRNGIEIEVGGSYPFGGEIPVTVKSAGHFRFALRIPGWCRSFRLTLNGEAVSAAPENGYITLERNWNAGDRLGLTLDMPVEVVRANPAVTADAGRIALMRGPLVYALESTDNGRVLSRLLIDTEAGFTTAPAPNLPDGVLAIRGEARLESDASEGRLYYRAAPQQEKAGFTAIPYALWQNRGPADLLVWMRCR